MKEWPPKPLQRSMLVGASVFCPCGYGKKACAVVVSELKDVIKGGHPENGREFEIA
jgi:hypothetical protein